MSLALRHEARASVVLARSVVSVFFMVTAVSCESRVVYVPEGRVTYEEVVESCGLNSPLGFEMGAFSPPITAACSEASAAALNLDWTTFGEVASGFAEPSSPAEFVVAGLLLQVGETGVSVAELTSTSVQPDLVGRLIEDAQDIGLSGEADSSALRFAFLQQRIRSIEYTGSNEYVYAFREEDGAVLIGDILDESLDDGAVTQAVRIDVLESAGLLFHEASHSFYGGHVECVGGAFGGDAVCDDGPDGPYGSGVWWLYSWVEMRKHESLEFTDCMNAASAVYSWCARFNGGTDWYACVDGSICTGL